MAIALMGASLQDSNANEKPTRFPGSPSAPSRHSPCSPHPVSPNSESGVILNSAELGIDPALADASVGVLLQRRPTYERGTLVLQARTPAGELIFHGVEMLVLTNRKATARTCVRNGAEREVPRSKTTTRPDAKQTGTQPACQPEDGYKTRNHGWDQN